MITTRDLMPDDWRVWRDIRLAALGTDPGAFGSRYCDWVDADEARWRSRIEDVELTVLLEREGVPVGVVCLARDPAGPELISLWIAPQSRGTGAGDAAVRHIVRRAGDLHPGEPVVLHVKKTNRAGRRLYARNGFVVDGSNPDDPSELRMHHPAAV
jgi:ribosomal protein S18 acetylase RimI-like enzyme